MFAARLKDHDPKRKVKTAVGDHCFVMGHRFVNDRVQVLDRSRFAYTRKLKESWYIQCESEPLLNNMHESLPIYNDWALLSNSRFKT